MRKVGLRVESVTSNAEMLAAIGKLEGLGICKGSRRPMSKRLRNPLGGQQWAHQIHCNGSTANYRLRSRKCL